MRGYQCQHDEAQHASNGMYCILDDMVGNGTHDGMGLNSTLLILGVNSLRPEVQTAKEKQLLKMELEQAQ